MTTQINSWYKTGTVSVTGGSAEVTGAGTSFLSQVHPGDIFTVDKSRIYEVASVTDDTALVLTEEYQGTTLSGASYFIIRFWNAGWSMNASLAQQVSALIQDVREKLDGIDAFETKVDNIEEGADVTDIENIAESIHGADAKTTPVDTDELSLIDSEASNVLKKLPWSALKGTLLASYDETLAGTENQKAVTPAGLTSILASDSEVLAGTENHKAITPAGLAGVLASDSEVLTGIEDKKVVTPAGLLALRNAYGMMGAKVAYDLIAAGLTANDAPNNSFSSIWTSNEAAEASSLHLPVLSNEAVFRQWHIITTSYINDVYYRKTQLATETAGFNTVPGRTCIRTSHGDNGADAWSDWTEIPTRVVGTMGHGSIMQIGCNANGTYLRFADGTQICWQVGFRVDIHPVYPAFEFGNTWTFPASFSNINCVLSMSFRFSGNPLNSDESNVVNPNGYGMPFHEHTNVAYSYIGFRGRGDYDTTAGNHAYVDLIMIGRWY